MNHDQIIKLARECEAHAYTNRFAKDEPSFAFGIERLKRFAELVAAAEREACAAVCDDLHHDYLDYAAGACAIAIRERGQEGAA